jgi:hypothetical protein
MYNFEEFRDPFHHYIITPDPTIYSYLDSVWDGEFFKDENFSSKFFERCAVKNTKILDYLNSIVSDFSKILNLESLPTSVEYKENIDVSDYYTIDRGTHLDKQTKELIALWYFKHPHDSGGMDLYICNKQNGSTKKYLPYSSNKMILFKNHTHAWHGVTYRQKTQYKRKSMYIYTERKSLVNLSPKQLDYLRSTIKNRKFAL